MCNNTPSASVHRPRGNIVPEIKTLNEDLDWISRRISERFEVRDCQAGCANIHVSVEGSSNESALHHYKSMSSNIPTAFSNNYVGEVDCNVMVDEFACDVDVDWNLQGKVEKDGKVYLREIRFAEMQMRLEDRSLKTNGDLNHDG